MKTWDIASNVFFALVISSSVLVALISYRFVLMGIEPAFLEFLGETVLNPRSYFVAHVVAAPIALIVGGFQFITRVRRRLPDLHRFFGRLYAAAIFVGGISALTMAIDELSRPIAALGYGSLAILWLGTTVFAIRYAMQGDFFRHRRMMIRSFALTFAGVTLRLQLPFLLADGSTYLEISHIVAWSCWVPNMIFAQLLLRWRP